MKILKNFEEIIEANRKPIPNQTTTSLKTLQTEKTEDKKQDDNDQVIYLPTSPITDKKERNKEELEKSQVSFSKNEKCKTSKSLLNNIQIIEEGVQRVKEVNFM